MHITMISHRCNHNNGKKTICGLGKVDGLHETRDIAPLLEGRTVIGVKDIVVRTKEAQMLHEKKNCADGESRR